MLRMRDNATVQELRIPNDALEVLQKIVSSDNITEYTKQNMIRKLSEGSPCCVCRGIPSLKVSYPVPDGGATLVERYCEDCIKKVYQREQVL